MSDKPNRRWLQFSLKTMLVGMTISGVLLGVAARWVQRSHQQVAALSTVRRLGGYPLYRNAPNDDSWAPDGVREWLSPDYFYTVTVVDLELSSTTDSDLRNLQGLQELEVLYLNSTPVTDAGLVHLHGLKNLRHIFLYDTQVTDAGVAELQEKLPDCRISRLTE